MENRQSPIPVQDKDETVTKVAEEILAGLDAVEQAARSSLAAPYGVTPPTQCAKYQII
jgi:hypothetical protein